MKRIFTILFFSLYFICQTIYSQSGFNVSTGIGFAELLNIGLHYNLEEIQIGFNVGTWPNKNIHSFWGLI